MTYSTDSTTKLTGGNGAQRKSQSELKLLVIPNIQCVYSIGLIAATAKTMPVQIVGRVQGNPQEVPYPGLFCYLSARFSDYFKNILARPLGFFYERSK